MQSRHLKLQRRNDNSAVSLTVHSGNPSEWLARLIPVFHDFSDISSSFFPYPLKMPSSHVCFQPILFFLSAQDGGLSYDVSMLLSLSWTSVTCARKFPSSLVGIAILVQCSFYKFTFGLMPL
jgi:hypothetical protein